jgi:hypothetical protein
MSSMPESLAVKRIALLPASPAAASASSVKIRRYKMARLRLDDRVPGERFAYLKRSHD